jgi:hypothetical protein
VPEYRVYHLDASGHVDGPPDDFTCKDDDTAIARAKQLVDGHDVELWDLDRLVVRLESPDKLPSAMSAISIDTTAYERKHGKPMGRAFWTFRVISPSLTTKDTSLPPTAP